MSFEDNTSIFNKETKEWTVNFPSGRQINMSNSLLSTIYDAAATPNSNHYKTILRAYEFSTCPGITEWKKEHENDMSQRDVTFEELEKMLFDDCDKYGTENIYQDVKENAIEMIHYSNVLPGGYIANTPNWGQIIAEKEKEDEERDI